jgi:hypothetical protein
MNLQLQLNQAIKVGSRELTELTLREPVTRDFLTCGLPMAILKIEADREIWAFEFRAKPLLSRLP